MTEEEIKQIIEDVQGKNGNIAKQVAEINVRESLRVIPLLRSYIKKLETESLKLIDELSKIKSTISNSLNSQRS